MSLYRPSSFNTRAEELLARIDYRRATTDAQREAIFRLRHDGYVRDGGIEPLESGLFSDPWDNVPNVDLVGVYLDDELVGSVRVHLSGPGNPIPASGPFGDVIDPVIERHGRLVDATRFVIDSRRAGFAAAMPFLTLRAVAMAAEYYEAWGLVATVREEHAVVYRRVTGHRALTPPRAYPLLRKPIMCMIAETANLDRAPYSRHPFLRSTSEERERVFGSFQSVGYGPTLPDHVPAPVLAKGAPARNSASFPSPSSGARRGASTGVSENRAGWRAARSRPMRPPSISMIVPFDAA